jgi:hypothetical protein
VSQAHDPRAIDHTPNPARVLYSMRALGRLGLPEKFALDGNTYRLHRSVKHDFVAATGFYRDDAGEGVVLKISRTAGFMGIPLRWTGRWVCRREVRFYRRLHDLPNVPRLLGLVGDTGFVHEYVRGRPLAKHRPVPDGFFAQLQELLVELHRRDIAYVDTNKPENILLGDDGRPHLIDFQISMDLHTVGKWPVGRWLLRHAQREDFYHLLKHKRRLRRDELTEEERQQAERKSFLIRAHRFFFKPYFLIRRRLFRHLRETGRLLPEGSK